MEYYIDKFGLNYNYDKTELKNIFKNKIKEIKNIENLSDNDKEIYLKHLSEIYNHLKENIIQEKPVINNINELLMKNFIKKNNFNNGINNKNMFGVNKSYKLMKDKDGTVLVIEKDETIENDKKKENIQGYIIKNNIKKNIDYNEANKLLDIKINNPLLKFLEI